MSAAQVGKMLKMQQQRGYSLMYWFWPLYKFTHANHMSVTDHSVDVGISINIQFSFFTHEYLTSKTQFTVQNSHIRKFLHFHKRNPASAPEITHYSPVDFQCISLFITYNSA